MHHYDLCLLRMMVLLTVPLVKVGDDVGPIRPFVICCHILLPRFVLLKPYVVNRGSR